MAVQKREELLELGTWIGRKQALATVAGGCSAADAECLRQMRDQRTYRQLGLKWAEFCKQRLGMSQPAVDKIIHRLEEFGPQYFRLAQATGITADEYRSIAGQVSEQGLSHAGECIPINSEHAPRLIAAVAELQRQAQPADGQDPADGHERAIRKAEAALAAAVAQIARLYKLPLSTQSRQRLVNATAGQLQKLEMFPVVTLDIRK